MAKPLVLIMMGSDSDLPIMLNTKKVLDDFGVSFEMTVASAHRTPDRARSLTRNAEKRGVKVIIAAAGMAAHLAGAIASETILPVIGVPIDAGPLKGMDALLSTVQMPGGIPVATVSIGKAGAKNAGILAVEILATSDKKLTAALKRYRKKLAREVEAKAKKIS